MKNLLITIVLSVLAISCSSNVDLAIDNPTKGSVIVKIDTLTVEIPANEVVWVEMGKGKHTITLENDSIVEFDFQANLYMLNPTFSEYFMYEEIYGSEMYASASSLPNKAINYLGVEMEGNYDVVSQLINPVTWDCGPREQLPEMVEVEEGDNYASLIKLCDPNEFIAMVGAAGSHQEE